MKKILIPTDFSKNAEHALKVAAQIAKKTMVKLFYFTCLNFQIKEAMLL